MDNLYDMFESSITIKGGAFEESASLKDILIKRMNIVYGRNGSGKSTIARAFREQQADYQQNHPGRAFALSFDEKSDSLPAEAQNRLFVFNEDFVDDNVRLSKGGLKSIVRIGASAELEGPIEELKDQITDLQKDLKPLKEEYDALCGTGEGSISASEKIFKDGLKAKGGFLDRLNQIEGRQHNLINSLWTSVQNALVEDDEACSLAEEAKKLAAEIERYRSYQEGSPIRWQAPSLAVLPDLDAVNNMLGQVVRPAELSEQERAILDDLSNALAAENFISKTQTLIVNNDRNYCPLCHQTVSPDHKHLLEQRIFRFRDKQVEAFKNKVELTLDGIVPIQDSIPNIPGVDFTNEQNSIASLNKFIADICQALERKKANPFSAIPALDKSKWEPILTACQDALKKIAEEVGAYNTKLEEKETLLSYIKQKNISLAARESRDIITALEQKNNRKSTLEQKKSGIDIAIQNLQHKLRSLQGQLDQINDARDQINKYLDIIFGERKLQLSNDTKETYKLQLRKGKDRYIDIPPRSVSSGERNALALAYFFACILEKKDKNYNYGEPTLLIIDDPVSSFDAENKAGVISLLSLQCEKVLSGNPDSKILIFTHDQTTLRTLCENRLQFFPKDKEQTESFFRLTQGHKLRKCLCSNIRGNMEYFSDLTAIFNFATCIDPEEFDDFETIGNTIRSFAEFFATHMYKCSWLELFSDNKRLECLPCDIREKIKAFAIRSVLNSESHSVFSDFEPAEIQRSAKMLLVFMYYSNYEHLYAYLVRKNKVADDAWKMEIIENWGREF